MGKIRDDNRYNALYDYLTQQTSETERICIWNCYCEYTNTDDYQIYSMDEIDDFVGQVYITEIWKQIDYDFNLYDDYFYYNGNGMLCSTDFPNSVIDFHGMICYILRNSETFGNERIKEIIEG